MVRHKHDFNTCLGLQTLQNKRVADKLSDSVQDIRVLQFVLTGHLARWSHLGADGVHRVEGTAEENKLVRIEFVLLREHLCVAKRAVLVHDKQHEMHL